MDSNCMLEIIMDMRKQSKDLQEKINALEHQVSVYFYLLRNCMRNTCCTSIITLFFTRDKDIDAEQLKIYTCIYI